MAATSLPSGQGVASGCAGGTRQAQLSCYAAGFASQWGSSYSAAFLAFAAKYPSYSPSALAKAYAVRVALAGLQKGLTTAVTGTATAQGQVIKGAVAGADKAAQDLTGQGGSGSGTCDSCVIGKWDLTLFTLPCILTRTNLRAIIGGLMLGAAGVTGIVAVLLLGHYALNSTSAGKALTKSAATAGKAAAVFG